MAPASSKCSVCGQACKPWERNTDGTYTHTACPTPLQPVGKGPKGGNVYNTKGET